MAEILGQSVYLLLVLVVGSLTFLSWAAPRWVEQWTKRYYEWVLGLLGFKTVLVPAGKGLLFWNRFAGPLVFLVLLLFWKRVLG